MRFFSTINGRFQTTYPEAQRMQSRKNTKKSTNRHVTCKLQKTKDKRLSGKQVEIKNTLPREIRITLDIWSENLQAKLSWNKKNILSIKRKRKRKLQS